MRARSISGVKIGFAFAAAGFLLSAGCTPPPEGGGTLPEPPANGQKGGSGPGATGGRSGSGGNGTTPPGASGGTGGTSTPSAGTPGRVTIRRLNRAEYDNTVRDLLGLDLGPSKMFDFVEDEFGDGFNNDADVLSLSPISIEKYLTSAQFLIDKALDPAPANAAVRNRLLVCTAAMPAAEADCTNRILETFVTRAFRRPVEKAELEPYAALVATAKGKGETYEAGLKVALAAVLVSPDFLFRVELDPKMGDSRALDNYEVASRLSYFLWASMPDDELFNKAKAGMLTGDEIGKQARRMLADPKVNQGFNAAMIDQWLQTGILKFAEPDVKFFPKWQAPLRAAMEQEVRTLMGSVLSGQASAQDLVKAKYVYANKSLATYYGLPGAAALTEDKFSKVDVTDKRRGGLLRTGSFLVLTSLPDTHSPTRRGVWILERLLCLHPPAPPAMIPAFQPNKITEGTLRQKLEKTHSGMGSSCMGCHAFIDPMGFALENFDGAGLWRDTDNNLPVDATGLMPGTGEKFNGAEDLSELLAKDPRFPACMAKQVLTYALGRKMKDGDQAAIKEIGEKFASGGFKVPTLIELVAQSPLMTTHRADKE